MAGLIDKLIETLNKQAENYEDMLALSYEKNDVIIKNDITTLQKITSIENALVGKSQRLEKNRASIMKDVEEVLGKNQEMSLGELLEAMEGKPSAPELKKVRERIAKTVAELKEINDRNMELIGKSLEHVEFSINLLRSSMARGPAYSTMDGEGEQDSRNLFDAKQ